MSGCDFHDTTGEGEDRCSCGKQRIRVQGTIEDRRTRAHRERLERAVEVAAYFLDVAPYDLLDMAGENLKR